VYFNDSSALGANRKFYEQCELPERGIEMLPELNDHEFIFHQPEADIMRRLSHKLDRDLMAVIGTSRTVARVDEFMDRYPVAKHGPHHWKFEMLKAQGASEAAARLARLLEEAREADLEAVS
jgi:hypothetical protein